MFILENITNEYRQSFSFSFNSQTIAINLVFQENTQCWIMNIKSNNYQKNGIRLCSSINLLNSGQDVAGFNMICLVNDPSEPMGKNDFVNGRCQLSLMDLTEYNDFIENLFGGNLKLTK